MLVVNSTAGQVGFGSGSVIFAVRHLGSPLALARQRTSHILTKKTETVSKLIRCLAVFPSFDSGDQS
jgi:hypothetical protein